MSLCPEVSGFSLATLRSFVGSGEPSVADRAAAHTREMYSGADDLDAIVAHVRAIVLGTTGTVEVEDQPFVYAVIALAHLDQQHLETDSNSYNSVFADWVLELDEESADEDHTEFAEDFFGWLEKIRDAGLDYFFYAE